MKRYGIVFLIIGLNLFSRCAHAEVRVEESGSNATFRVNGKPATAVDASNAAKGDAKVERCTPIKGAETKSGEAAFRCKRVDLIINPKTGTTKWKAQ